MEDSPVPYNTIQPPLFEYPETSIGSLEFYPLIWSSLEAFTSPDNSLRLAGLKQVNELGAARYSPLVAYTLATRLVDPDVGLRGEIIKILGEVLSPDRQGKSAPEAVIAHLSSYLRQMRRRPIFALLEAALADPSICSHVEKLLHYCPYGGNHLVEVLSDRMAPMHVRITAAKFIGLVGYLDTLPALERLEMRMSARLNGQQSMPFISQSSGEGELLPVVQKAIRLLKST
jgi:hypothetical protein